MLEIVESSVNRAGSANVLQITERAALFSVLKLKNPFPPFPPLFLLYPSFFFFPFFFPKMKYMQLHLYIAGIYCIGKSSGDAQPSHRLAEMFMAVATNVRTTLYCNSYYMSHLQNTAASRMATRLSPGMHVEDHAHIPAHTRSLLVKRQHLS